jgi:hypothetical protein
LHIGGAVVACSGSKKIILNIQVLFELLGIFIRR